MTNILSLPEAITHAYDTLKVYIHKNGTGIWNTVKGPMAADYWPRHLKGDERFGVPFLVKDRCRAAMIDVDDHSGVGWDTVTRAVDAILNELSAVGLIGLPFRSGGGAGINIWIIWSDDQQAAAVRAAIRAAVERAGYKIGAGGIAKGQVEVFPKQDKAHGVGNCAALPRTALDSLTLEDIPLGQVYWSTSAPVPEVVINEKPTGAQGSKLNPEQLEELLGYIPNDDLDYDAWWSAIMAIHDAGGTLEQAEAWSAKSTKHTPGYLPRKWRSITGEAERRVTARTLKKMAADAGWEGSLVDVGVFPEPDAQPEEQGPTYRRVSGKGRYAGYKISNTEQLIICMSSDPVFPWVITFDDFTQDIRVVDRASGTSQRYQDAHLIDMARWFDEQRWEPVTTRTLREIVNNVSSHKRVNIAVEWASGRAWDGHDRYREALEHSGIAVNDYSMAVMRYWWSAHGGRVVSPGHQCDSIIVLQGDQGIGKSRLIQALAPDIGDICTYRDITIDQLLIDDKSARALKGCLVANMDEMRNFSRREAPEVKAALSKRRESYVPKYLESRQEFGRQCLIYATNNEMEFLDDSSGNRRYYVLVCSGSIDVDWFEANREQLWAQGIADFRASGVAWKRVSALAPDYIITHEIYDEWTDLVSDYLETLVTDSAEMTLILEQACGVLKDKHNQTLYKRVGKIMKNLGWERTVVWEGKPKKVWKKVTPF